MNRTLLVAVLLVTAGLAGCIGNEDTTVEPTNATDAAPAATPNASLPTFPNGTPAPTSLRFTDCTEQWGGFPVPASVYEDRVPEGFELASYRGEPTGQTTYVGLFGFECKQPDGSTVRRASTYLIVDPPAAWEHPDEDVTHEIMLSVVTSSQREATVNAAWGFGDALVPGDVAMDRTGPPEAERGTLAASAGDRVLELATEAGGAARGFDGRTLRLFALGEDGTVAGAKDLTTSSARATLGHGTGSGSPEAGMPEDHPVATGLGAHAWGFDLTYKYVDLPPREDGGEEDAGADGEAHLVEGTRWR